VKKRTRIVVLHMKEILYTAVFVVLALVLILLITLMFKKEETEETGAKYRPGVYTAQIPMEDACLMVEVVVDADRINAVSFRQLSEDVAAMYPLMQPCMDRISQQLYKKQSLKKVKVSKEGEYTSQILMSAIEEALNKAAVKKSKGK